jgi:TonB family protein
MNRLQKKCVMATAGVHLLLLVILFVGPAFFYSRPKADDLQVLDVIPAHLIDAAFNSGVANAQPPPPAPVAPPQPPPPKPVVTPPAPAPEKIVKAEPVKPPDKLSPDNLTPVEKPAKTEPRKIQISTQLVTRTAPKNSPAADNSQQQQRQAQAIQSALRNLKSNLTPGTTIDMPGNSSVAYANYASAVKSIYEQAWVPPDNADNDEANAKVSVTIANDGTVISAHIVTPSGDAGVDASVQRTLNRVTFIEPFPDGAKEKERTYIINFNLKTKRLLG